MNPTHSDKGDCLPLAVPEIDCRDANTWNPTNARLIRMAKDSDALVRYYRELKAMDVTVRIHELDFQETGEPIAADDARELAMQMKALYFDENFIGLDDWRAFLTGRCLTLRKADGKVHSGEFVSATVRLESTYPEYPVWPPFTFAFPAELESAFGVQTLAWVNARIETVSREFVARTFGEPNSQSGNFGFVLNHSRNPSPEPGSILVVPASIEDTIENFTTFAAEKIDHWEALATAAAILLRYQQPLGDALSAWVADVLSGRSVKPDGRTVARSTEDELRDRALREMTDALVRCGLPKTGDFRDARISACLAAGDAFGIDQNAVSKAVASISSGNQSAK